MKVDHPSCRPHSLSAAEPELGHSKEWPVWDVSWSEMKQSSQCQPGWTHDPIGPGREHASVSASACPVRYDHNIPLRLRSRQRKGRAFLHRLHTRFKGTRPASSNGRRALHAGPPATKADLLRGLHCPRRRHTAGEIPENGLGQTLPQESVAELSHGEIVSALVSSSGTATANYEYGPDFPVRENGCGTSTACSSMLDASAVTKSFLWGLDLSGSMQGAGGVGGLLAVKTNGVAHFCAYDGNGNVAALVNAVTGENAAQYEYGPFGEVIRESGVMAKVNPFRFSTKYQDSESDLLYYGYRFYNPSAGRWLSRDPIEEVRGDELLIRRIDRMSPEHSREHSNYACCENNLISGWDYLGLYVKDGNPKMCPLTDGGMEWNGETSIPSDNFDLACLYKKCGKSEAYTVASPIKGTESESEEWDDIDGVCITWVCYSTRLLTYEVCGGCGRKMVYYKRGAHGLTKSKEINRPPTAGSIELVSEKDGGVQCVPILNGKSKIDCNLKFKL